MCGCSELSGEDVQGGCSPLFPHCPQLEINDVTRAWGLEVDRVELAVEAVLQPPQDSLTVPSLDSTLQQLALHLLGGSMNSAVGRIPSPGPDTLEMINEVEPPASLAGAGTEPSPKQPVAEGLLTALQPFLSEALVNQVGACYQFNVILPSGTQSIYFLDLTTGGRLGLEVKGTRHLFRYSPTRAIWRMGFSTCLEITVDLTDPAGSNTAWLGIVYLIDSFKESAFGLVDA
ncbi:stomatin-like protein 1 [Mus caroli]|uniref:Stomatin-like protein 1 n=1 Tax=Mus caroli TaxID=10089 RepID=A0A6P5PP65_MUSCR|nr:stomatin-like protein 1 [Mus caroli]